MKQEEADWWADHLRARYPAGVQVTVRQISTKRAKHPRYDIEVSVPCARRILREGRVENMPGVLDVCGVLLEKNSRKACNRLKGRKTCKKMGQKSIPSR